MKSINPLILDRSVSCLIQTEPFTFLLELFWVFYFLLGLKAVPVVPLQGALRTSGLPLETHSPEVLVWRPDHVTLTRLLRSAP